MSDKPFRPMLADTLLNVEDVKLPALVSPKLDGIRAIVRDGVVYSRNMKAIPSAFVQKQFAHLNGADGELIVGSPTSKTCFRDTTSAVMTKGGELEVNFHIFDHAAPYLHNTSFVERLRIVQEMSRTAPHIRHVPHYHVTDYDMLLSFEMQFLKMGYEGAMVRSTFGPYKQGRSTVREGWLLKLKRFMDGEARVIGYEQFLTNMNELKIGATGYAERSSHQENLVPTNMLGALIVKDLQTDVEFNIGTGFTHDDREGLWESRGLLIGKIVKYKYFPTGGKDKPRFPVFLGFRSEIDL